MKKLIIWLKLVENKDLGALLTWLGLGLGATPPQGNKVEEPVFNNLVHREEMKLTQLESYLSAEEHQGIVNLALYL